MNWIEGFHFQNPFVKKKKEEKTLWTGPLFNKTVRKNKTKQNQMQKFDNTKQTKTWKF